MLTKILRCSILPFAVIYLTGCAVPPKPVIDMTSYSTPSKGTAGVYFYQWKTGFLGAAFDAKFIVDGKVLGAINTGEYMYFDVPAGQRKYRAYDGLISSLDMDFQFVENQNYFFRGHPGITGSVYWINEPLELTAAAENIRSGRYKKLKSN